jgi:glycosyltransferase involved in cell wall biosynthesis
MPPAGWASNIVRNYNHIKQLFGNSPELILVQDGSDDNIQKADLELLHNNIGDLQFISYEQNRGKGYAIREGVKKASGNIIIYTDIDFPYNNDSIHRIYTALINNEAELAIGVKDEHYYKQVVRSRRIISRSLQWMIKFFLSIPVTDTQCGLKGFKKEVRPVFLATTINRYLFDLEFIRNSARRGCRLKAVPITLNKGIHISRINYRILLPEVYNFLKVLLSRR